jgi:SAM-dependent methyltransferase
VSYSLGISGYYDLFPTRGDPWDEAASFLHSLIPAEGNFLDIGAGTGTTAIALAERGVHATALEPDPEMYAAMLVRLAARQDLAGRITPVPKGAGFDLTELYDVVASISVLHLLSRELQDLTVRFARSCMKSAGAVVLDLPVESPSRIEQPWTLVASRHLGRTRFEHHSAKHPTTNGAWKTLWRFVTFRNGIQIDEVNRSFDWVPLSHDRTEALLSAAGLRIERDCESFASKPYVPGRSSGRLIVARAA